MPGEGDLRRRRNAGAVEELYRAEQAVLQGPSRSEARDEVLIRRHRSVSRALAAARALRFWARRPARWALPAARARPRADFRARRTWHARRIFAASMSAVPDPRPPQATPGYHGAASDFKRRLIETTLHETRGNRTHAARALGLQRTYLLRLIRDLGVAAPPPAARGRTVEQRGGQEGPPVSPPLHAGRDHRVDSAAPVARPFHAAPEHRLDSPAASAAYPPRRPPARASGDNGRRPPSRLGGSSRP